MVDRSTTNRWQDMIGAQSLDEYLEEHYGDPSRFRISRRTYQPGKKVPGCLFSGMCFVARGRCRYEFKDVQFELNEGQVRHLTEGEYSVEAVGDGECEIALVFERSVPRKLDDQIVLTEVIEPAGGVECFRLTRYSDNSKGILLSIGDGRWSDLLLEEDGLADATVAFLERAGVPEVE